MSKIINKKQTETLDDILLDFSKRINKLPFNEETCELLYSLEIDFTSLISKDKKVKEFIDNEYTLSKVKTKKYGLVINQFKFIKNEREK